MGLGKTRQAIVALRHVAPNGPYLVVCPASVKRNWAREINIAAPDATTHIIERGAEVPGQPEWVIVNYDILSKHMDTLGPVAWAGLVFDEAHYLKNHISARSRLARQLADRAGAHGGRAPVVYLLTGTPLTNRPRDLFVLLQLVGHSLGRSFLGFAKRYCAAEKNEYGWQTRGASNIEELTVQLHGVMLRRSKDQVLALPPKLRTWLPVQVPKGTGVRDMRKVVDLLVGETDLAPGSTIDRRRLRGRLLHAVTRARQKLAEVKLDATIEFVTGAVEQGEKVIVFSCFEEPMERLARAFGSSAVVLTGKTHADKRQDLVGSLSERRHRPRLSGQHHRRRNWHQPDCRDAGRLQRSRLGACQPLAGGGSRLPHRSDAYRQRDLHGGGRHDRRFRPECARQEGRNRQRGCRRQVVGGRSIRRCARRAAARAARGLFGVVRFASGEKRRGSRRPVAPTSTPGPRSESFALRRGSGQAGCCGAHARRN